MEIRSDFALECQLIGTRDLAESEEVKAAIGGAISHIGGGRRRRGGAKLLELLEAARECAEAEGESGTVDRLRDAIDYATGKIFSQDFGERYPIHGNPARDEGLRKLVSQTVQLALEHAAEEIEWFLESSPEADVEAVLAYLRSTAADARYLEAPEETPSRYRYVRGRGEIAAWLNVFPRDRIDVEAREEVVRRIVSSPEALQALAADEDGRTILKAVELQRRDADLRALRELINDPGASEAELQRSLQDQHWIFGGQFVGTAARRSLVLGSEVDIPLLRADGVLHIVELKRSMSLNGGLVTRHGGNLVATAAVHQAVSQAINYLVRLDENRHHIRAEFGIETRRASALVLIGHPGLHPDVPEEDINEALRVLNAHLSRIEVLTYKSLVDSAERSLGMAGDV